MCPNVFGVHAVFKAFSRIFNRPLITTKWKIHNPYNSPLEPTPGGGGGERRGEGAPVWLNQEMRSDEVWLGILVFSS